MSSQPPVIDFNIVKCNNKIAVNFTPESIETHNNEIKKALKKGETKISYQKITQKKARSNQQNRFYWGKVLRLIAEYVDKYTAFVKHNENGAMNYDMVHTFLMLEWCNFKNKEHLIEPSYGLDESGNIIKAARPRFSFDKMKHEEACEYLEDIETHIFKPCTGGAGFNTMLERERMEVQ